MLVYQRLLFAAKSPRSAKWLFLNASRAAPAAAPRFGQRHSPLLARPGKRNRSATGTATKKNRWWSPSPRHILDIFAELVWKSRWRAQNLIVKHHVPMTEWQFWRWIMLDPLFQRQCSGSSMYHTWPTFGWFSEMIWIYLDIYLDISGYIWMISSTTMGEEIPTWRSTRFSFQFPCRASHLDECPQPENPTGGSRGSFTRSSVRRFAVKHLRRVGLIYC